MDVDDESDSLPQQEKNEENLTENFRNHGRLDNSAKRQIKKTGICDEKSDDARDESFKRKKVSLGDGELAQSNIISPCDSNTSERSKSRSPSCKGDGFPKIKSKFKNRNYRNRNHSDHTLDKDSSEDEDHLEKEKEKKVSNSNDCSPDSGVPEASSSNGGAEENEDGNEEHDLTKLRDNWVPDFSKCENDDKVNRHDDSSSSTSIDSTVDSSSDSSTSAMEDGKYDAIDSDKEEPPSVLLKQKPRHKWFATPEIVNRQMGFSNTKQGSELFQQRMYGSLHSVQRLELMYKLKYHSGCVNSVNFNHTGTLLASGSDDLQICLWDWPLGKLLTSFDTGHQSNVFQAKFLPLVGDTHMVTCARDGQIRLIELSGNGELRSTKKLAQHRGPAHKLATQKECPHVFLSCGEDALVMNIDVRQPKPTKVLFVTEGARKVSLYSIHLNPLNNHEFVVGGRDNHVRIYDQRNPSSFKSKFCPQHLKVKENYPHVTCSVFNYNGTEIVASYNDEDIYVFDTRHSYGCDFVHRYQGHRNNATVKGVNFFGPKSEFIVSGSDCGNIFFWEKETEAIVQWMAGDENGVVNCLEPHPKIPVLATSGLDEDVKIWVPSCEQEPTLEGLKKTVVTNLKSRHSNPERLSNALDGQMLWILWRHIRRTERRAGQEQERIPSRTGREDPINALSSGDSSGYSDDEDGPSGQSRHLQCSPS